MLNLHYKISFPKNSRQSRQLTELRAGVSKCGTGLKTLLRGPTQWCVQIFEGVHQVIMVEIGIAPAYHCILYT